MLKHEIISRAGELPVYINYYTDNNRLIPSHWHNHLEIIFIYKGKMNIALNNDSYILNERDFFVINSSFIHLTKVQQETTVLLLQIPYELIEQSIPNISEILFLDYFPYAKLKNDNLYLKLVSYLTEMKNIYLKKEPGYPFLFNSVLNQFLYELYTNCSQPAKNYQFLSTKKPLDHLKKAVDYINSNYKEPISLSEIASHLALNPEYFCRMFKKNMGVTFLEYLNQIRLIHIYEDLMSSNEPISTIRERHGFTNYKLFNKMFKESYGFTASTLRRRK